MLALVLAYAPFSVLISFRPALALFEAGLLRTKNSLMIIVRPRADVPISACHPLTTYLFPRPSQTQIFGTCCTAPHGPLAPHIVLTTLHRLCCVPCLTLVQLACPCCPSCGMLSASAWCLVHPNLAVRAVPFALRPASTSHPPSFIPPDSLFGYPVIGNLKYYFLVDVSIDSSGPHLQQRIPHILYALFQSMFAAITPLLITGSFAERTRFKASFWFIVFWEVLVYYPVAHWVWNRKGFLNVMGVHDFAGGLVVHWVTGVSSIVCAVVIGPRSRFRTCAVAPVVVYVCVVICVSCICVDVAVAVAVSAV